MKTFNNSWDMPPLSEVEADVWIKACPENMVAAGFYMQYDPTRITILGVEPYDNMTLPGPWDNTFGLIIPDVNGPGTYLVHVMNINIVAPDADGDIVMAKVLLRLTSSQQTTITFSTMPGFDTVVDEFGTIYDPQISPKVISIDIQ